VSTPDRRPLPELLLAVLRRRGVKGLVAVFLAVPIFLLSMTRPEGLLARVVARLTRTEASRDAARRRGRDG